MLHHRHSYLKCVAYNLFICIDFCLLFPQTHITPVNSNRDYGGNERTFEMLKAWVNCSVIIISLNSSTSISLQNIPKCFFDKMFYIGSCIERIVFVAWEQYPLEQITQACSLFLDLSWIQCFICWSEYWISSAASYYKLKESWME